jgi:uncharacterized membrane protein
MSTTASGTRDVAPRSGLLAAAKDAPHRALNLGFAAATIVLSWLVTQVVSTLHYADEYYRPSDGPRPTSRGSVSGEIETRPIGTSSISRPPSARHR